MTVQANVKIGVISDTHGHFEPRLREIFAGVNHILHGGDIGLPWLILELEDIAPVTAVTGNTDAGLSYKDLEVLQLGARKFLVHHIVDFERPQDKLKRRIIRENPDVVIFGHTHKRFCEMVGNTLYLNPGYAGRQRFDLPRSVAILHCDGEGMTAEFAEL